MRRTAIAAAVLAAAVPGNVRAQAIADVFDAVRTSVVEIATAQRDLDPAGSGGMVSTGSLGSGFLISADGAIITAAHVVQAADRVAVRFTTGDVAEARVVASSPAADVALVRVPTVPAGISPAVLGDSDAVRVGDQVFVVGAPFGISHTLTVGHVSGRREAPNRWGGLEPAELLQTDAAINTGNSGGPMFDLEGRAIGVVSHILSQTGGFQGIGFVVTSNLARRLLLEAPTPWTGIEWTYLEGGLAALLNVPGGHGLLVQRVAAGSPAEALGLQPGTVPAVIAGEGVVLGGDIILSVQGIPLDTDDNLRRIGDVVAALASDQELVLEVLRGGVVTELRTLGFFVGDRSR